MAEKDYYGILGVSKDASDDDIKKAYRHLAKKWHPDMNPDNRQEAESKFKDINEAYEVLSNPQKKKMYDQFGTADPQQAGFGGDSGYGPFGGNGYYRTYTSGSGDFGDDIFGDIFSSFFGGGFGGRSSSKSSKKTGPIDGTDIKTSIDITFEESYTGVEKEIYIMRDEVCDECNGSGAKAGTKPEDCPTCHGTGEIQQTISILIGQTVVRKTCPNCNGTGKVIKNPCTKCKGKGKVRKQVKIKVKVPAGIDNENVIRIEDLGNPGTRGGNNGDVYVTVHVKKSRTFTRDGYRVQLEVPITITQATLGANLKIPLVDGGEVEYTIPAGTQNEDSFTIKDKGFKVPNSTRQGDLIFTVIVNIPKRLTGEQRKLFEQLAKTMNEQPPVKKRGFFG